MRLPQFASLILLAGLGLNLAAAETRWFDEATVSRGKALFLQNCANCHGVDAEGTADWKKTDAKGNYPPPPLNGSAHAWHHSIPQLARSIKKGGIPLGGTMPAFENTLSDNDIFAVIAYFQSRWPDEVYRVWLQRSNPADIPSTSPGS